MLRASGAEKTGEDAKGAVSEERLSRAFVEHAPRERVLVYRDSEPDAERKTAGYTAWSAKKVKRATLGVRTKSSGAARCTRPDGSSRKRCASPKAKPTTLTASKGKSQTTRSERRW
jgi:hypothetical protein